MSAVAMKYIHMIFPQQQQTFYLVFMKPICQRRDVQTVHSNRESEFRIAYRNQMTGYNSGCFRS